MVVHSFVTPDIRDGVPLGDLTTQDVVRIRVKLRI